MNPCPYHNTLMYSLIIAAGILLFVLICFIYAVLDIKKLKETAQAERFEKDVLNAALKRANEKIRELRAERGFDGE